MSIFTGATGIYIALESVTGVPCFVGLGLAHLEKLIAEDKAKYFEGGYPHEYNITGPWALKDSKCTE